MTSKRPLYFKFLEYKVRLVAPLVSPAGRDYLKALVRGFRPVVMSTTLRTWLTMNREIVDQLQKSEIPDEVVAAIDAKLVKKFGFSSFGKPPSSIVARVLQRGKLRGANEAALLRAFLSGDYGGDKASAATMTQMLAIYDTYEAAQRK